MTENNIGKFGNYGQPDFAMEEITEEEMAKAISHPVLTKLNKRLEELQNLVAEKDSRILALRDKYRSAEYQVEAQLKELLDDEVLTAEQAQGIADIFDRITLTKQVEIAYTITATVTVEVPYGADPDEVADNIYVERVEFYTDFENADVLESDHEIEDWRVRS
jgi:hypothetical protein